MKSTRSWTKAILTLSLVILLGVGIFGLGVCKSQDETNEPSISEDAEQSVLSEDNEPNAPPIYTEFPFDADEAQRRQDETAEVLGVPIEYENEIGMKFRLIPAGEFMMGSPKVEEYHDYDEILHRVHITKPYYLGVCEVTQKEWEAVMRTTPWRVENHTIEGSDYPATFVSWEDAQTYCERLSEIEGRNYRLPTEAEWEYSCRAGSSMAFCFGDSFSNIDEYAWYYKSVYTDQGHPIEVGLKCANAWGLHDMHGNIYEWCQDWYNSGYYEKSPTNDPTGTSTGKDRVRRGGNWDFFAGIHRSAHRNWGASDDRYDDIGFRVVCSVETSE